MPSKQQRYITNRMAAGIDSDLRAVYFTLLFEPTTEQVQRFKSKLHGRGYIDGKCIEVVAVRDKGKLATVWEALTVLMGREPCMGDV